MSDLAEKLALASRYNVLSGCVTLEVSLFKTGLDELRTLESENARLRKAIEAAPHGKWCRARGICECWKSKALGEQK